MAPRTNSCSYYPAKYRYCLIFTLFFIVLIHSIIFDVEYLAILKPEQQETLVIESPSQQTHHRNILHNNESFNQLLQSKLDISSKHKHYPSSWQELNQQLLCPIKYSTTYYPLQSLSSTEHFTNSQERILKKLYQQQFIPDNDCSNPNIKYLVFDIKLRDYSGLGATLYGSLIKYLTRALMTNRTFLVQGRFDWTIDKSYCSNPNNGKYMDGIDCYFIPLSNCNEYIKNYLKQHNLVGDDHLAKPGLFEKEDVYIGSLDGLDCNLGDEILMKPNDPKNKPCPHRIIYINRKPKIGWGFKPTPKSMQQWLLNDEQELLTYLVPYHAVTAAFLIRPRPEIWNIVLHRVRDSLVQTSRNLQFNPFKSIAFPIRASDKCRNADKKYGHDGEMVCWDYHKLLKILNAVKYLNDYGLDTENNGNEWRLDTVIVTSEDHVYLRNTIETITDYVDDTGFKWNVVTNVNDYTVGEGTTKFKKYEKRPDRDITNGTGMSLESDVIVSGLVSFMLQVMNSKYLIYNDQSNWLRMIWDFKSHLNCESLFWRDQLKITQFDTVYDGYIDSQCVEMVSMGFQQQIRGMNTSHIKLPFPLWTVMKQLNLTPRRFRDKFGIDLTENGWHHQCHPRWDSLRPKKK